MPQGFSFSNLCHLAHPAPKICDSGRNFVPAIFTVIAFWLFFGGVLLKTLVLVIKWAYARVARKILVFLRPQMPGKCIFEACWKNVSHPFCQIGTGAFAISCQSEKMSAMAQKLAQKLCHASRIEEIATARENFEPFSYLRQFVSHRSRVVIFASLLRRKAYKEPAFFPGPKSGKAVSVGPQYPLTGS